MAAVTKRKSATFLRPTDPPSDQLPETFIDRYTEWAHTQTDSPIQYHRAVAAGILSTMLTPYLTLRVRHGRIIPNIWLMILAGTTTTRKSTTLNIATELLDDIIDDWQLGTDGSPEGLMTELGFRDGKISVFLRDEIAGFMSSVSGRDYMSGTLEAFCQLYDGVPQSRVLRREKIVVKKPYFVIMGGGIKTRMEEVVTIDHIRSGFIPRFLIVSGTTTSEDMVPIGPPSDEDVREDGESPRDQLVNELWSINQYYARDDDDSSGENVIKIAGIIKTKTPSRKHVALKGTPEYWQRLQQLEKDAIQLGERSSAHELYTPLYLRLSQTVNKIAILLAGADKRDTLTLEDLQRAIHYSQEWVDSVTDFATNIEQQPEMDKWEKRAEKIVNYVKSKDPIPVTQTEAMQKFRIRKRDIADIEATLMSRGAVQITPYPHKLSLTGSEIRYTVADRVHAQKGRPLTRIQREDSFRVTNGEEEGHPEEPEPQSRNGHRIRFPGHEDDNI